MFKFQNHVFVMKVISGFPKKKTKTKNLYCNYYFLPRNTDLRNLHNSNFVALINFQRQDAFSCWISKTVTFHHKYKC